jgi:Signal peptidase subunit
MYAWYWRLSTIGAFAVIVLFACLGLNWASSLWLREVNVECDVNVRDARLAQHAIGDDLWSRLILAVDIQVDMSSMFNWNTKQIFFFISVHVAEPDPAYFGAECARELHVDADGRVALAHDSDASLECIERVRQLDVDAGSGDDVDDDGGAHDPLRHHGYVIWDRIVEEEHSAVLDVKGVQKYVIAHNGDLRNATLILRPFYDVTPIGGIVYRIAGDEKTFVLDQ